MADWRIAAAQIDVACGDCARNLAAIQRRMREAAQHGARLVIFPECALTGYAFESLAEALPFAETVPGPTTSQLATDCHALGLWAAVGMLERVGDRLFNACVLIGPEGQLQTYRKIHLPFLGIDRFATPGDRPFAVHDLGGLRVGMNICYDGSFPESARVLTLLGADLILLPTNWPTGARPTVQHLVQSRALENHVFYAAVNRVGEERGFRFIGQSRIVACNGELIATASHDAEELIYADIDPEIARQKRLLLIPGKYELDRVGHRRPEMYGPLCEPKN